MNDERYRIKEEIGTGGFGDIYLADDLWMNRETAIKELRHKGPEAREEVEIMTRLKNSGFPIIYDAWEEKSGYTIVMEYVKGQNLATYLSSKKILNMEEIQTILSQISKSLSYLHSLNPPIAYRDLKPQNIMLQENGVIKIVDFGSAKSLETGKTRNGISTGTIGYASLQQLQGEIPDLTDDVYSFGVLAHYLITKQNPAHPPYQVMPLYQYDKTISEFWNSFILKCSAKERRARYQNMVETNRVLQEWITNGCREKKNISFMSRLGVLFFVIILEYAWIMCEELRELLMNKGLLGKYCLVTIILSVLYTLIYIGEEIKLSYRKKFRRMKSVWHSDYMFSKI